MLSQKHISVGRVSSRMATGALHNGRPQPINPFAKSLTTLARITMTTRRIQEEDNNESKKNNDSSRDNDDDENEKNKKLFNEIGFFFL